MRTGSGLTRCRRIRGYLCIGFVLFLSGWLAVPADASTKRQSFQEFIASLWPLAEERGVSRATFDCAFLGVSFDRKVVANANIQAEFAPPIRDYIDSAVTPGRIERGRAKAQTDGAWLAKANETFGVYLGVIMGIWGLETDFGEFTGSDSVIRALASLAFVRFRDDYFRDELLSALVILDEGDIAPSAMLGSWAGAMGQTQFMPSSFLVYAIDFEDHGRRDIWTSEADAIGSTANFLAEHGWKPGSRLGLRGPFAPRFRADGRRFVGALAVRGLCRSRRPARRRRAAARNGRRPAAHSRGAQGPDLPHHEQLRRHQGIQPFHLLCACGRIARRRHRGPRTSHHRLAEEGQASWRRLRCADCRPSSSRWGMTQATSTGWSATCCARLSAPTRRAMASRRTGTQTSRS